MKFEVLLAFEEKKILTYVPFHDTTSDHFSDTTKKKNRRPFKNKNSLYFFSSNCTELN